MLERRLQVFGNQIEIDFTSESIRVGLRTMKARKASTLPKSARVNKASVISPYAVRELRLWARMRTPAHLSDPKGFAPSLRDLAGLLL